MSRKRIKQYLILLTVVGLVTVVGSGTGTFASFTAEVQHNDNYFATGTLLLHSTSNGTTCASETNSGNLNVSNPTGCTTLFNPLIGSPASGTLDTAISAGAVTSIIADLTGSTPIEPGDLIKLDDGTNVDTFTAAAQVTPGPNASIPVVSQTVGHLGYTTSTPTTNVSVLTFTKYAQIALKNAGTLTAKNIKFSFPTGCTSTAGSLALGSVTGSVASGILTLSSGSAYGAPTGATITVNGTDTYSLTAPLNPGQLAVSVTPLTSGPYTAAPVTYAPFAAGSLCPSLKYAIVQTNAIFAHSTGAAAINCAYGASSTVGTSGIGCDFATGAPTVGTPNNILTDLDISQPVSGSSSTELGAGGTRYFVMGIQTNVAGLGNSAQNQNAQFAVKWHIDQK